MYVLTRVAFIFSPSQNEGIQELCFSKENIFDPLKIKLSFYPTPDLMEKLVALTIRKNGKLELYEPNIRVAERDPEKGTCVLSLRSIKTLNLD